MVGKVISDLTFPNPHFAVSHAGEVCTLGARTPEVKAQAVRAFRAWGHLLIYSARQSDWAKAHAALAELGVADPDSLLAVVPEVDPTTVH